MKKIVAMAFICFLALQVMAQKPGVVSAIPDTTKEILIAEAACGECLFGLPGAGCDLAVRIDGQAYYVDGTDIDSHGDAHGEDGFCMTIRKAEIQGEVINNRFKATYFHLVSVKDAGKD